MSSILPVPVSFNAACQVVSFCFLFVLPVAKTTLPEFFLFFSLQLPYILCKDMML